MKKQSQTKLYHLLNLIPTVCTLMLRKARRSNKSKKERRARLEAESVLAIERDTIKKN